MQTLQRLGGGALLTLAALTLACATKDAPRAESPKTATAATMPPAAADDSTLTRGEFVFSTRCDACHRLPLPESRNALEWRGIMVTMSREARLQDADRRAVEAYLAANARDGRVSR